MDSSFSSPSSPPPIRSHWPKKLCLVEMTATLWSSLFFEKSCLIMATVKLTLSYMRHSPHEKILNLCICKHLCLSSSSHHIATLSSSLLWLSILFCFYSIFFFFLLSSIFLLLRWYNNTASLLMWVSWVDYNQSLCGIISYRIWAEAKMRKN